MNEPIDAPFPWFGGKSMIAAEVWRRFGDVAGYIEPFFGTGAVLLGAPWPSERVETVNDADALLCNFWRAVKAEPERLAELVDWPVNECVPAGTLISTPSGDIPVERIAVGTTVYGECGGKVVESRVTATRIADAPVAFSTPSWPACGD